MVRLLKASAQFNPVPQKYYIEDGSYWTERRSFLFMYRHIKLDVLETGF